MAEKVSLQAIVCGRVQGVFFRDFVRMRANELGLAGYVRNLPDGSVEAQAEGEKELLEKLIGYLKVGPAAAKVEIVITHWSGLTGNYHEFRINY